MGLRRYSLPSAALAALLLASCAPAPMTVIADVDSDYDDMVSLAYLCARGTGAATCGSPR
jgi:hypothetical protein